MRQYDNTNDLIKWMVIACDFILLNSILLIALLLDSAYLHTSTMLHPRVVFCIANLALAICETKWSPIVHRRTVPSHKVVSRVTRLVFFQAVFCFFLLQISDPWTSFFQPVIMFNVVFLVTMLLARMVERWVIKRFRKMGRNTRSVIFVGNDEALREIYDELVGDATTGYKVMGYFADEPITDAPEELVQLGSFDDLEKKMNGEGSLKADDIFCGITHGSKGWLRKIIKYCDKHVMRFYYVPRSITSVGVPLKMERLGDQTIFTNYEEPLSILSNRMVKRTFDIVMSALILICLLPFIPIIALIIKLQSPGPIFFKQERTGINGKNFYCYKFRSMHVNKDSDLVQATEDDPRKFAFGNFMRKTNIDELPQFFNVFIGNMSIVGPRPHMLHHTEVYSQLIDKYMVRHFVKPGITGWAQVTGYRGETKELWQMEERVKRDIWYIENWSIWLDLRIIWRTAKQMVVGDENAY